MNALNAKDIEAGRRGLTKEVFNRLIHLFGPVFCGQSTLVRQYSKNALLDS